MKACEEEEEETEREKWQQKGGSVAGRLRGGSPIIEAEKVRK